MANGKESFQRRAHQRTRNGGRETLQDRTALPKEDAPAPTGQKLEDLLEYVRNIKKPMGGTGVKHIIAELKKD